MAAGSQCCPPRACEGLGTRCFFRGWSYRHPLHSVLGGGGHHSRPAVHVLFFFPSIPSNVLPSSPLSSSPLSQPGLQAPLMPSFLVLLWHFSSRPPFVTSSSPLLSLWVQSCSPFLLWLTSDPLRKRFPLCLPEHVMPFEDHREASLIMASMEKGPPGPSSAPVVQPAVNSAGQRSSLLSPCSPSPRREMRMQAVLHTCTQCRCLISNHTRAST